MTALYSTCPPDWRLARGEVQIFMFYLSPDPTTEALCRATLAAEEVQRTARFRTPELRARFAVGRGMARRILGRFTGLPADSVRLGVGPHGKPYLPDHPAIEFNLSHSGDLALMAVAGGHPIGIDLEALRAVPDASSIAERYFAPGERADLARLPLEARELAFLRCWTRKEAYLKALGTGLQQPLDGFRVSVGSEARFLSSGPEEAWSLRDVSPESGYVATACAPIDRSAWRAWRLASGANGP